MNHSTFIALKKSFLITLLYVGLGTISVLCLGPNSPSSEFINDLLTLILFVTIPVTFISIGIMYSSPNYDAVLIVQSIIFLLFWLIVFSILNRKNKINAN
ncbi:MAG: hypothetical protein JWQ66_2584 [Mucilaginibacter sp.]|nr:hypothetical protein [Mucilaginibacter sp.]